MSETFDHRGKSFHVAERVGLMPMMRFAVLAKQGVNADEMEGLAAMYGLLQNCIHPGDWERFEQHAIDERLDGDELLEVVGEVMLVLTDRPTERSSDSSDGPQTIEAPSTAPSSVPDISPAQRQIDRLNREGRPDLALIIRKRQESLTA